jgi:hypothetical protein
MLRGWVICGALFLLVAFFLDFAEGLSLLLWGVEDRVIVRPLLV